MKATLKCETRINTKVPSRIVNCSFQGIPREGFVIINLFTSEYKSFVVPYLRPYINKTQGYMANLINLNNARSNNNQQFQDFISEITDNYTLQEALDIPCTVEFLGFYMASNTSENSMNLLAEHTICKILRKYGILMKPDLQKYINDYRNSNLEYNFEWIYWVEIINHPLINTVNDCPIVIRRLNDTSESQIIQIITKWNYDLTGNHPDGEFGEKSITAESTTAGQFVKELELIISNNINYLIQIHGKF